MATHTEGLTGWAAVLEASRAASLARLRTCAGVQVLAREELIWLRGEAETPRLGHLLAGVPCRQRYRVDGQGLLIPRGKRLPRGRLPDGAWVPIADFVVPRFQSAAFPGEAPAPAAFSLVRRETTAPAAALLTEPAAWRGFGESAPGVRLQPLRFAMADDGRVLVLGTPLPAVPGTSWYAVGPLLIQAGWQCEPGLALQLLPRVLHVEPGDRALLHADGSVDVVPDHAFVPATRPAIRMSVEEAADG